MPMTVLSHAISNMQSESKIVEGELYTLDALKDERSGLTPDSKKLGISILIRNLFRSLPTLSRQTTW